MSKKESRHPQGYWMSVGISTGVGIGAALGVAMDNIGAGIATGVAIGAGIGASLEERNRENIRPQTDQEKIAQRRLVLLGFFMITILILALALVSFLKIGR
jgi:F0F1-type ATP synthase membrane subunit c/vacuolar-type H+-ATPase subunit K